MPGERREPAHDHQWDGQSDQERRPEGDPCPPAAAKRPPGVLATSHTRYYQGGKRPPDRAPEKASGGPH